jgi:tetratricopeptide (TPR) repeat protein
VTQVASSGIQGVWIAALQHYQAGRLAEAERLFRQVVAVNPRHADSLHLLGVIAYQTGRHDLAADLIRQAITINSREPSLQSSLGNLLLQQGRLDEAVACYRRAIELKPDFSEGLNNLGNARSGRRSSWTRRSPPTAGPSSSGRMIRRCTTTWRRRCWRAAICRRDGRSMSGAGRCRNWPRAVATSLSPSGVVSRRKGGHC